MLPTLSGQDTELLATLRDRFRDLETRVVVLEQELAATNAVVLQIQNTVETSVFKASSTESIEVLPSHPLLDPPPLVNQLSPRTMAVDILLEKLHGCIWLAIHGSAGIGKTQLVLLLTQRKGKCRAWLRFRDLEPAQSHTHAIRAFEVLSGCNFDSRQSHFFSHVCSALGAGAMLVLDDLLRAVSANLSVKLSQQDEDWLGTT